jgi:hypothetical protein
MPQCACGCGEETKRSKFLAGHDQKMRKQLEQTAGGLLLLSSLVKVTHLYAQDRLSLEDLGRMVKQIYQ